MAVARGVAALAGVIAVGVLITTGCYRTGFPSARRMPPALPAPRWIPEPSRQLGIDLLFYAGSSGQVADVARADVAYVRRLHANALSVSFPFFMTGPGATGVEAGPATPSPAALAVVARLAEAAGLYVTLRPLLDEHALGTSRTGWKPARPASWFGSYQRFLLPYARMAQQVRVPVFVIGVEFSQFGKAPQWTGLAAALGRVFHGVLSYASNFDVRITGLTGPGGVRLTVDAYPPMPWYRDDASAAALTVGWRRYAGTLPPGTVLSEVGIAAQPGAFGKPYVTRWPGEPLVPAIQAHWFNAACAAASGRLGGLYFWSLAFGQDLAAAPTTRDPASFVGGLGAIAIASCFSSGLKAAGQARSPQPVG